ncbi:MAG: threonylcarbamoyl-AMP synthase [Holosporales bacterium]|jgi:L-threonylcarbamoyladenylate synthase|nr:threonylcarbamoyl-AMP synthase [Holosporales bacterium]
MKNIQRAVELLKRGDVVAAPTETVYGLFADACRDTAIQRIYQIKGRPSCNPLIIHVSGIEMAKHFAVFSETDLRIATYFWEINSFPLTLILKAMNNMISKFATAGLDTVAIRVPHHPIPSRLITMFGGPLAAPSANTSNGLSPTSFDMVYRDLGKQLPLILDGGQCSVGIESTILDLTTDPFSILRPGGVPREDIEDFVGYKVNGPEGLGDETIVAPGMMKRHYSPNLPLRCNALTATEGEAFIAFGPSDVPYDFNLSKTGNLREAARNLFYALQTLDRPERYSGIAVAPIPNFDLGVGINDRLNRASHKL